MDSDTAAEIKELEALAPEARVSWPKADYLSLLYRLIELEVDWARREYYELVREDFSEEEIRSSYRHAYSVWVSTYREVIALGGVAPFKDHGYADLEDVPACIRRRDSHFTADVIAAQFGLDTEEFVRKVYGEHRAWFEADIAIRELRANKKAEKDGRQAA